MNPDFWHGVMEGRLWNTAAKMWWIWTLPEVPQIFPFWVLENAGESLRSTIFGKAAPFQGKLPSLKHEKHKGSQTSAVYGWGWGSQSHHLMRCIPYRRWELPSSHVQKVSTALPLEKPHFDGYLEQHLFWRTRRRNGSRYVIWFFITFMTVRKIQKGHILYLISYNIYIYICMYDNPFYPFKQALVHYSLLGLWEHSFRWSFRPATLWYHKAAKVSS